MGGGSTYGRWTLSEDKIILALQQLGLDAIKPGYAALRVLMVSHRLESMIQNNRHNAPGLKFLIRIHQWAEMSAESICHKFP